MSLEDREKQSDHFNTCRKTKTECRKALDCYPSHFSLPRNCQLIKPLTDQTFLLFVGWNLPAMKDESEHCGPQHQSSTHSLTHVKGFRVAFCCTSFVRSTKIMELYHIFAQSTLEFTVCFLALISSAEHFAMESVSVSQIHYLCL